MHLFGFSTGALAKGNVAEGFKTVQQLGLSAVELSALRYKELHALVAFIDRQDLSSFSHVSVHAPTDYTPEQELEVSNILLRVAQKHHCAVVIHPDCMFDPELWNGFGEWLWIENMDKRKIVGRTAVELAPWFERFPNAGLCFDIAHAHQVDTSMTAAYRILRQFGDRICQMHVSEVTSSSKHDCISENSVLAFQEVSEYLPPKVPVILETPVTILQAVRELKQAARIFERMRASTSPVHG